jgi:hypothetical protein
MKIKSFTSSENATLQEIQEMLEAHAEYIKLAVDIRENMIAGGGEFHADCEAILLMLGCNQDFRWGADWIPETQEIKFEALINIQPRRNNPSTTILDPSVQKRVESVVRPILGKI